MLIKPKNKKGNIVVMLFFIFLLVLILILGFLFIVGNAILNWTFDIATPELVDLGVIDSVNMTDIASYTITPLNNVVQSIGWVIAVLYIMALVGTLAFVVIMRASPSRWLMGLYIALMIILVIACMFMSNIYEEFRTGTDDLAVRLQEQTLLDYMILYSPAIFTIIGFIGGAIMFSGIASEEDYI